MAQESLQPEAEVDTQNGSILHLLEKFSSFNKILRILGHCLRWRIQVRQKEPTAPREALTTMEWTAARRSLIYLVQRQRFGREIDCCRHGQPMPRGSPLMRLAPFLDEENLLRVGGRLHHANISYQEKHPLVLSRHELVVRRMVEYAHLTTLHGGPQVMASYLGRSYWIVGGNRLILRVFRLCVTCARFKGRVVQQQMAPLPACRLNQLRPFIFTGVDFAGPFPLRFSKGRGAKSIKGYLAVFVCMATKAVHLEVVSDLTTDAFLAAYARFTARRGVCAKLYSDNGTTFRGAANELKRLFNAASDEFQAILSSTAAQGTSWEFIPPRAPHFGGLWEAAVKSFKYHYRRVLGENKLTYEEMTTLSAKIEDFLNSRPLSPMNTCGNDIAALTPGHFLIGSALLSFPEPSLKDDLSRAMSNRWELITAMRNSFWIRWRKEVLHHMQQRNRWSQPQTNLKEGDVVLVKDELTPPARWPLARVSIVHPGNDQLVRVATVKTATTQFTRPVAKLILLPLDEHVQQRHKLATAESAIIQRSD